MRRTQTRPLVTGAIEPAHGLAFGVGLGVFSFAFLWATTTLMAASLATAALLFYVLVYTVWLKRRTPQNIVIGGAAGAFPPMVGWAAVTGDVSLAPLVMFAIIFFWTPPHFWALALLIKRDYAEAGIPMLPVVRGERETTRQIVIYSFVLVAITLLPVLGRTLGAVYLVSALLLGLVFIGLALALQRQTTPARARRLFSYSLAYLALLFVAMAIDPVVIG